MTERFDRRSFLQLAGAGALAAAGTGTVSAETPREELRAAAREDVASGTEWSTDDLTVVNDAMANFPTIGERYYRAKLLDPDGGRHESALDEADGTPVDLDSVQQAEYDAYADEYGKLTPELATHLDSVGPGEQVEVGVWHEGADRAAAKETIDIESIEDGNEAKRQLSAEVTDRIEEKSQTVADALAGMEGTEVREVGVGEPRVGALATPAAIDAVAEREDVTKLFLAEYPEAKTFLDESSRTHGTHGKRNGDYDASGYRVGVYGLQGYPLGHDLNVGGSRRQFSTAPKSQHADLVALAAASTDDSQPGAAHEADVYCAAGQLFTDSKMSWFADHSRHPAAVNLSWGLGYPGRLMREPDFRFNDYGINHFLNVVVSAGNEPAFDSYNVSPPGRGFNQITVGAIDNEDTGNDESDDQISTYSCWKEPITKHTYPLWDHYPMDKPELSAVGDPTSFPGYTGATGGTSFSAPQVAGMAALLEKLGDDYGHWPSFAWHPELAKPILMATATNTGDGSYEFEEMGTGSIYAPAVEELIDENWYRSLWFWNWGWQQDRTFDFHVEDSDTEVRVALSWLTESSKAHSFRHGNPHNAQSDINLDLSVWDPDDDYVIGSWNWDAGCQYCTFNPLQSGTYEIRVSKDRWDTNDFFRFAGLAWHRS